MTDKYTSITIMDIYLSFWRNSMLENKTYPKRYHIKLNGKRTTISVERTLNDLACTHLGQNPYGEEAHSFLREKIQEEIDKNPRHYEGNISQGISLWIVLTICQKETMTKWIEHINQNRENQQG